MVGNEPPTRLACQTEIVLVIYDQPGPSYLLGVASLVLHCTKAQNFPEVFVSMCLNLAYLHVITGIVRNDSERLWAVNNYE